MPKQLDPKTKARKAAASALGAALEKHGLAIANCGDKTEKVKDISTKTGFWADPADVTNKPTRWLIQLYLEDGNVKARVPPGQGADRLAFVNATGRSVGGVSVRVIPAIRKPDGSFEPALNWEWLLLIVFAEPLEPGTSAQLIEGFNPNTGDLSHKGKPLRYVSVVLFSLCEPGSVFSPDGGPALMTYGDATKALAALLQPVLAKASKSLEASQP